MKKRIFGIFCLLILFYGLIFLTSSYELNISSVPSSIANLNFNSGLSENIQSDSNGFCPEGGCGQPNGSEEVDIILDSTQLTTLANEKTPAGVMVSNIKIEIKNDVVRTTFTSMYPPMVGKIYLEGRVKFKHFYVDKGYLGRIPMTDKMMSMIEANGDMILKDALSDVGIQLQFIDTEGNNLHVVYYITGNDNIPSTR